MVALVPQVRLKDSLLSFPISSTQAGEDGSPHKAPSRDWPPQPTERAHSLPDSLTTTELRGPRPSL